MDFAETRPGMGVVTGGLKLTIPGSLGGFNVALGGHASILSDLDQTVSFPQDHARFNNAYVVASRPIFPNFHVHAGARVGFVRDGADTAGAEAKTVQSLGFGADYQPNPQVRLVAEFLNDQFSDPTTQSLGAYGQELKWDGLSANLALLVGLRGLGDLRAYVHRANRADNREAGIALLTRL